MTTRGPAALILLVTVFAAPSVEGQELSPEAIPNWPAPGYWEPPGREAVAVSSERGGPGQLAMLGAEATSPLPFVAIAPCRVADTRGNGFTAQAGPPALSANVPRTFKIAGLVSGLPAPCGVPDSARAVSFNFAVTSLTASGNLVVYPAGTAEPTVSSLNWSASTGAISNAAVVALGTGGERGGDVGAISVKVNGPAQNVNLIIDINGYYAATGIGVWNTFLGSGAGNFTMSGESNTAFGFEALHNNFAGDSGTALGRSALASNTMGDKNTAVGRDALISNQTGHSNTAVGYNALRSSVSYSNTAVGHEALRDATKNSNTAVGYDALWISTGAFNTAIGPAAGSQLTTGDNNICIDNPGMAADAGTIRIGSAFQTATYLAGVSGRSSPGGVGVLVTVDGKLGTATSSRRYKDEVRDIGAESDRLMALRPVTFRYKRDLDPTGLVQYGLIAEEVVDVYPELVALGRDGEPETVRYHEINALLLNEAQKQHSAVEGQERTIQLLRRTVDAQREQIEQLEARLARVEARIGGNPPD